MRGLQNALVGIRHEKCLLGFNPARRYPLKSLRNKLIDAMALNTATQPAAAVFRHVEPNTLRHGKHAKQTVVWNPLWDSAPRGAFYKARRACSLVTDICLQFTGGDNILHDLERLTINIWRMPKKHFDGLLRTIRAKMARASREAISPVKSPEALLRSRPLTSNPSLKRRVYRFTSKRLCRHNVGFAAQRLTRKIELVRESLTCTKCTYAVCTAKWFTNHGFGL